MYLSNALRFNIRDAIFYSLMVGFGEVYFSAYSLALGHSVFFAGMLTTAPLIFGGALQLLSPQIYHWIGSHKKIVVIGVLFQALCFAPLAIGAFFGKLSEPFLFITISLYWALFLGLGPSWNVWQKSIIPEHIRTRFFSDRTMLMAVANFLAILLGGTILDHYKKFEHPLTGFAILFLVSGFFRLCSVHYLKRQPEERDPTPLGSINKKELFAIFSSHKMGKTLLFILIFRFAVFVSAPYFGTYMLKVMKLDYFSFTIIVLSSVLGRVVIMRILKHSLTKHNTHRFLFLSVVLIAMNPFLWTLTQKLSFIMPIEFISGVCWGIFDLTFFLLTFNEISKERQPVILSTYNFINTIVMGVGTFIGGTILNAFGNSYHGNMTLFLISSCARAAAILAFPGFLLKLQEVKKAGLLRPL